MARVWKCARTGLRELIEKRMSVENVVEILARDKPFYGNSGSGVTVSGGEPTVQADFRTLSASWHG